MPISCAAFGDVIARKTEHLDENIIMSMHPLDSQWIGHVSTGRFKAEDGVEHTYDRFENVFPQIGPWGPVRAASCVGTPCDKIGTKVGLGFTRKSYQLEETAYETDLFCWDLILSADRASQQFAHFIKVLRRVSTLVWSYRFRAEALRIAKFRWVCNNNGLTAVNATWDPTMTQLTLTPVTAGQSSYPTSQLGANHLQRRVDPQIRSGADGPKINKDAQPMLELVTFMDTVWNLTEGNPELTDHWRFKDFADATKYYKYGWTGKCGNYGLRADAYGLRFNILSYNITTGVTVLGIVFPYKNISATEGIKEDVNPDFDIAAVQIDYIWHRMAMTSLVRDAKAINPEMPFAARDFAGKWQFVMDNLTCGTGVDANGVIFPIPVANERRNKGKFITDFGGAIRSDYPELAEAFISIRSQACITDMPVCNLNLGYPEQNYNSANAPCATVPIIILETPLLNATTGTYEIPAQTVTCNGIQVVHGPVTGTTNLTDLVAQLNTTYVLGALGTWAVNGSQIQLTTTACQSIGLPWQVV